MKEFGFYSEDNKAVLLSDEIEISNSKDTQYLVSNSDKLNADIVAPEINFYLKNSEDTDLNKAKNTLLLYEARATCFDLAKDIDYEKKVGKNVVLVSNAPKDSLENMLKEQGFNVVTLTHFEIKFVFGAVGELSVLVTRADEEFEIEADFFLVEHARDYMLRQSGCIEISSKSNEEILDFLNAHTPSYPYKSYTVYDQSICQYHQRRHEICARCVDVCPSVAILKEDETKELVFSHIDCVNCGECISVCPSGSLDYALMPRRAFSDVAKLYSDKIALILPRKTDLDSLDVKLPANVLPFAIEGDKFLNEAHLITLLQESGANIIYLNDARSRGTDAAIEILNQIYQLKFQTDAIFVAKDAETLTQALKKAKIIEGSKHTMSEYALPKREIFAKRLEFIVGDDDLGVAYTDERIRYGTVSINRDTCTLCLSCVGACNVSALVADTRDNSIKFNPSICTNCGYCELSCAEKDTIKMHTGKIELKPEFFTYSELAKDELFACVECGKEFATKKAIEKIANFMAPRFANDPHKIHTLYCCADCKAKVMIRTQLEAMQKGEFYE